MILIIIEMPRFQDLAIFVLLTMTQLITLSLAHACEVKIYG